MRILICCRSIAFAVLILACGCKRADVRNFANADAAVQVFSKTGNVSNVMVTLRKENVTFAFWFEVSKVGQTIRLLDSGGKQLQSVEITASGELVSGSDLVQYTTQTVSQEAAKIVREWTYRPTSKVIFKEVESYNDSGQLRARRMYGPGGLLVYEKVEGD